MNVNYLFRIVQSIVCLSIVFLFSQSDVVNNR